MRTPFLAALITAPALLGAQSTTQASALTPTQREALSIYRQLVDMNTVDGVGGTTPAAVAMATRFRAAGFPEADIHLLGPRPDKDNLVVRYRGRPGSTLKPVLLLAHLDVVQALKADWSPDLDPFHFVEKDGYFYGRGTTDDKAMASIFVANLLRLKREHFVPDRDIVVALTADEEGGTANGVDWLLKNHRDLLDAAFALNEGGGGALRDGKPFLNSVGAAEKVYTDFKLTVRNRGGHSSVPRPDNAIYQLAAALVKVGAYHFPVHLNEVTRTFFERSAPIESPDIGAAMRAIVANPADSAAAAILSREPRYNAMLRTTCVATMLEAGDAANALPQSATANVNCRMLPGDDPAQVRAALVDAIGDTAVHVSDAPPMSHALPSPLTPDVMLPIERVTREMFGDIPVIPTMGSGATDSKYLRAAGIPGYGVSGLFGDPNDIRAHGRNERMLVKSYFDGEEFLYRLVKAYASPAPVS